MAQKNRMRRNWLPLTTLLGVILCAGAFGFSGESRGKPRAVVEAPGAGKEADAAGTTGAAADGAGMPTRGMTLPLVDVPNEVEARHILIQFDGAWKKDSPEPVSRDAAKQRAVQALAALRRGAAFDGVLEQYCNNASVRAEQGKFPPLTRGQTMTAIANAVFPLKVGEYSEVTESVFGYHVFQRTK